ncbi:hypothetical protein VA596_49950 [Amycolatopsis sp., V23-08]|uniref:Uncharacterized protein n=1 Tax=Amycolatopsis heterodermiae TaxID=3110235 RepID=A0ABU5RPM1_9PSEU|nr:hypothetical protein [Amycolatopsis sp., V23-08]MEA5367735.1 hypothetical protein [Amycolatopsis sp., V23-08]
MPGKLATYGTVGCEFSTIKALTQSGEYVHDLRMDDEYGAEHCRDQHGAHHDQSDEPVKALACFTVEEQVDHALCHCC